MSTSPSADPSIVPALPALSPLLPPEHSSDTTASSPSVALRLTSKEWVIPPRPKPGRKPATDVPPTKRKAQNRAAQRAFRERRAAKVGELEEQMKEKEEAVAREKNELQTRIGSLEASVERFKGEVLAWQEKCYTLEQGFQGERKLREEAERKMLKLRREVAVQERNYATVVQDKAAEYASVELQPPNEGAYDEDVADTNLIGCGNCTKDTRCECMEQALNISSTPFPVDNAPSTSKRPRSPAYSDIRSKRQQSLNEPDSRALETDFTSLYSSKPQLSSTSTPLNAVDDPASPAETTDPCGFCQDGTPCVCAELDRSRHNAGIGLTSSQFTPPPADGDVCSQSVVRPPPPISACAGGPGSCAQCQADPTSTLFCKSLAALHSSRTTTSAPGVTTRHIGSSSTINPANDAITLSCADTYTTLARHTHFSDAADELDSWLGRLRTAPLPHKDSLLRTPLEIEAASVIGVLRFFDRRFGKGPTTTTTRQG